MTELPKTIKYPETFNESLPAQFDGPFHWEYLDAVFRPFDGITNCDVDSLVERGGVFLGLETKNVSAPIPVGQKRRSDALLATGLYTEIDIWGKEIPKVWGMRTWQNPTAVWRESEDCREDIAMMAGRWIDWANQFLENPTDRDFRALEAAWRRANAAARGMFIQSITSF